MKRYRKKPLIVWACQWTGENEDEVAEFLGDDFMGRLSLGILVQTPEGVATATKNSYLIEGVVGEHYPCDPDIFSKTYEEVE